MLPFWKPLSSRINRDDTQQASSKKKPCVNDDESDDDSSSQDSFFNDRLMHFGNREGHVAAVLRIDDEQQQQHLICFGGWVEADGSDEVLAMDVSNLSESPQWKVIAKSHIALRANATLTPISTLPSASLPKNNDCPSVAILFGGLDIGDSYDCTNDVYIVSLKNGKSTELQFTRVEIEGHDDDGDDDSLVPRPRQRHCACLIGESSAHPQLVIFGGEDDNSELLNDFWSLDLSSLFASVDQTKPNDKKKPKWTRLQLPESALSCLAPRAAARLFSIVDASTNEEFIALAGGLIFVTSDVAQISLNEMHLFRKKSLAGNELDLVSCKMNFFENGVNCLLAAPLSSRRVLLFGGKDFAKGNDDLIIVSILNRQRDGDAEHEKESVSIPSLEQTAVIKCPFKEADKEDLNDEALSHLDRTSLMKTEGAAENCWPHWRYAAAVAYWKDGASVCVACVGGTCRHVDPNNEVVVTKFDA